MADTLFRRKVGLTGANERFMIGFDCSAALKTRPQTKRRSADLDKADAVAAELHGAYVSVYQGGYDSDKDVEKEVFGWLAYFSGDTCVSTLIAKFAGSLYKAPSLEKRLGTMRGLSFSFSYRLPFIGSRTNEHRAAFMRHCRTLFSAFETKGAREVKIPFEAFYDSYGVQGDNYKMPPIFAGCYVVIRRVSGQRLSEPAGRAASPKAEWARLRDKLEAFNAEESVDTTGKFRPYRPSRTPQEIMAYAKRLSAGKPLSEGHYDIKQLYLYSLGF